MWSLLLVLAGGSLGLVLWEHVGRLRHWALRPSVPLAWFAQKCEYLWYQLGVLVGFLAGIWDWLYRYLVEHLEELLVTVQVLGTLLERIVLSPLQFLWGYTETFRSYLYQHVVVIGNAITLTCVVLGLEYWYWHQQWSQWSEKTQEGFLLFHALAGLLLILFVATWCYQPATTATTTNAVPWYMTDLAPEDDIDNELRSADVMAPRRRLRRTFRVSSDL